MLWAGGLVAWALLMALVAWGMDRGRQAALATYQGENARQQWEQWRSEVTRQQAEGSPVQRRIPKSAEPPALVLMRDYFWECLVGAWVVSTGLGLSLFFFVRGALLSPTWRPIEDPAQRAVKPRSADSAAR